MGSQIEISGSLKNLKPQKPLSKIKSKYLGLSKEDEFVDGRKTAITLTNTKLL